MPWKESSPMDQKTQFIADYLRHMLSVSELCDLYGISRKTAYKWIERYVRQGPAGLEDRSRKPRNSPNRTAEHIEAALLQARARHPSWGAKKLLPLVAKRFPNEELPVQSTVFEILGRHGMLARKRQRRRIGHPGAPSSSMLAPNDVWCADFKGQFKTNDGHYCYPLTVTDGFSRYLLGCQALHSTAVHEAKPVFTRLFREFGLPLRIRTDNGVPFATTGIHGLSQLNVWWLRLGIQHQRILPAHPEQNGAHERMHRTLKGEACRPPQATLVTQQRTFNTFRRLYNDERPHAALGDRPPAVLYRPSPRPYTGALPPVEYPGHFLVKRVTNAGTIRLRKRLLFLSNALKQHPVGLEEVDDGIWSIHFCQVLLGRVDERDYVIRP